MSRLRRSHRDGCCCRYREGRGSIDRPGALLCVLLLFLMSVVPVAATGCAAAATPVVPTAEATKPPQPMPIPTVALSATTAATPVRTATPVPATPTKIPATPTPTPRPQVLGPNLLPNPSFEDMVDGVPDGWNITPARAPFHVVRPGNNGRFAAGFSGGVPDTSLLLSPERSIPVYPGLTYKFVGWARGGGQSRGCAQIAFKGVDDGNAVCFAEPPRGDGSTSPVPYAWSRAEFTVNIPQDVTSVDLSLVYFWTGDAGAQVYWDDVYFGELERN